MKQNLNLLLASLAVVGACTFTSCDDDDDVDQIIDPVEKVFPKLPEDVSNIAVGDSGAISFNAYDQWTISADQTWVKFKKSGTDDTPAVSLSGAAGEHAVTYVIGDENMDFESKTAQVFFSMDNKQDTMVISRVGLERSFELFAIAETEEGFVYTPAESLKMDYNENSSSYHAKYAVRANYKWVLNVPEWIDILPTSLNAEPNDTVSAAEDLKLYFIDVNMEKATVEDMNGWLKFKDYDAAEDAPVIDSIAVSCPGTASWTRFLSEVPYNINFTAEGKYSNEEWGMEMDFVKFSLMAGTGNGYKFYLLPKNGEWYGVMDMMTGELCLDATDLGWFGIDESENMPSEKYENVAIMNYELWASPAQEDRQATFLAIPEKVAENIKDINTDLLTEDGTAVKADYEQYIVAEISQMKGQAGGELAFAMGSEVDGISIEPMSEEELGMYAGDFGVQQGYVVTFDSFENYVFSMLKLGNLDSQCVISYTDPDTALCDEETQGWLRFSADMGFQGFQFDFTNKFDKFEGPRQATVVLMNPETYQAQVVIRVVQNVDNGNNE